MKLVNSEDLSTTLYAVKDVSSDSQKEITMNSIKSSYIIHVLMGNAMNLICSSFR